MQKYNFSLRKPESTSIARLMGFNRQSVSNFFNALKELKTTYNFQPNQIYNVDETGVSTVATKNPRIITPKGKRRVIKISSAERGTNVTAVCAMNASGTFIPPFLIFPRVRMQPAYMNNTPAGFIGVAHETGWMTSANFLKYLEHFIQYARPSENNRVLLIMDNHASHVTFEAVILCRENYISLLGFPAHTSHRMQPLDVSVYGPLKTAYSRACDDFLTNNPGKAITLSDIASIFGKAYLKVATVANAISGFRATGVEPFDSDIFTDIDFETAQTTERELDAEPKLIEDNYQTQFQLPSEISILNSTASTKPVPSTSGLQRMPESVTPNKEQMNAANIENTLETPDKECQSQTIKLGLPPLPKANTQNRRCRKKLPSLIISSTPVKDALEQKRNEKLEKEKKKQIKYPSKKKIKKISSKSVQEKNCKANKQNKSRSVKRQVFESSDSSESSVDVAMVDSNDDMDEEVEEDDKLCIFCEDEGKHNELWFRCNKCTKWAHAECTGLNLKEAKAKVWICDFCRD